MLERAVFSWRPAFVPLARPATALAQAAQPARPAVPTGLLVLGHAIGLGLGAATTWVGFDTGARRSGLLSALGYVIGVGGALSAAVDLIVLGSVAYRGATGQLEAPAKTTLPLM